jgi:CheY-like chemotaxis protein
VTEQVSARHKLEVLATQAEAANRAKDEFLAMLGHELRNPLSPILTALQLLRLRGKQSHEQDIIERQVGHLARLVDDLLDVSRITQGKIELRRSPMEMMEAVMRAIETTSPLLEQRRHDLNLRIARDGLTIDADRDRMAQVISNLLTNASKYSEPGSRIDVEAWRADNTISLRVSDQGVGIPPDMIANVFDRFVQQPQTLDRSRGGLGLGLAIVRSLVEMHGGTVVARSEGPGRGSEFTITLPAVGIRPSLPQIPSEARAPNRPRDLRILVVDDNHDAAATLQDVLETLGYQVRVAHDGPSALRAARAFQPSIALLDIGLPVMDGYELAQRLRDQEEHSDLRMVAVTGYGQDTDRERSLEAGFLDHLVKPVDMTKLERVIERLVC